MEGENVEMSNNSGGHQVNSRWNPTKEQISILENMYRQGIRTPTADQIQQITARLKAFGEIEGKNVFYWFQNHKARQRQKQKQESLASISRFLHKSHQPLFAVPPNGGGGPYYLPQGEIGYYQQYPKVLIPCPAGFKRRHKLTTFGCEAVYPSTSYPRNINSEMIETRNQQQTLPLFPLHPTGNLQDKDAKMLTSDSVNSEYITGSPSSSSENGVDEDFDKPFIDFFSGRVPFESS